MPLHSERAAIPYIGYVDGLDGSTVFGWAYHNGQSEPTIVTISYYDKVERIVADQYRADLEVAGVGNGCHAFRAQLPCDPATVDLRRLKICFDDGTPLQPTSQFLRSRAKPLVVEPLIDDGRDLLASPVTETVHFEFTSHCNLRCVYCAVSQPDYRGQDMALEDFESIIAMLKSRKVRTVFVNGHGETTTIPGWHERVLALAKAGLGLAIITNLARLLSPDELAAMAHIGEIYISVDTHDPALLRQLRRRVDLGNILINMSGIRATAAAVGLPMPIFWWSCVVTDKVALQLTEYVRFALSCGVRNIVLCNLTKYDDVDCAKGVQHVTSLSYSELRKFSVLFEDAKRMLIEAGGKLDFDSGLLETVRQELARRTEA